MSTSPKTGTKVVNPMTGRTIKAGGAAYARLPAGTRVHSPSGKTYVVRRSSRHRSARPSSPLPKKGYVRYSGLKLGKKVKSPTTGREISEGSTAYRQLYSGVVNLKKSPNKGKCKSYPLVGCRAATVAFTQQMGSKATVSQTRRSPKNTAASILDTIPYYVRYRPGHGRPARAAQPGHTGALWGHGSEKFFTLPGSAVRYVRCTTQQKERTFYV